MRVSKGTVYIEKICNDNRVLIFKQELKITYIVLTTTTCLLQKQNKYIYLLYIKLIFYLSDPSNKIRK
jgi:hypothetical protein